MKDSQEREALLRAVAERDAVLRELEELRARAQIAEDNLAPLAKENYAVKADNKALRARLAAMVERVRGAGCLAHYDYGSACVIHDPKEGWRWARTPEEHDPRCPEALALALEEIAGKPDPGASPNPEDWPGGVPSDPVAYFAANPLTAEEERYAASVAGEEGPERQP